jgi:hypothetical protein
MWIVICGWFESSGYPIWLRGGYILAPSDHFFDADMELLKAYAEEAHTCVYA